MMMTLRLEKECPHESQASGFKIYTLLKFDVKNSLVRIVDIAHDIVDEGSA